MIDLVIPECLRITIRIVLHTTLAIRHRWLADNRPGYICSRARSNMEFVFPLGPLAVARVNRFHDLFVLIPGGTNSIAPNIDLSLIHI